MTDIVVYNGQYLKQWQEAYAEGLVEQRDFDRAWSDWKLSVQRALYDAGYDAELYVDPTCDCEVYERIGPDQGAPMGQAVCDKVEAIMATMPLVLEV